MRWWMLSTVPRRYRCDSLNSYCLPGQQRRVAHPDEVRVEHAAHARRAIRMHQHVAAGDVDLVLERRGSRPAPARRFASLPSKVTISRTLLRRREGTAMIGSPTATLAGRDRARHSRGTSASGRFTYCTGKRRSCERLVAADVDRVEQLEIVGPLYQGMPVAARHDVVALERRHRHDVRIHVLDAAGCRKQSSLDLAGTPSRRSRRGPSC